MSDFSAVKFNEEKLGAHQFAELLGNAEEHLWTSWKQASSVSHTGTKGSVREDAVARFLEAQLPPRFRVATGEAIDQFGRRTGQLDIAIYDANNVRPLYESESGVLLPAEALLATVEVKSKLDAAEVKKCVSSAKRLYELRPHGEPFAAMRTAGKDAKDRQCRCFVSVFAYETDLVDSTWPQHEYDRLKGSLDEEGCPPLQLRGAGGQSKACIPMGHLQTRRRERDARRRAGRRSPGSSSKETRPDKAKRRKRCTEARPQEVSSARHSLGLGVLGDTLAP